MPWNEEYMLRLNNDFFNVLKSLADAISDFIHLAQERS